MQIVSLKVVVVEFLCDFVKLEIGIVLSSRRGKHREQIMRMIRPA